MSGILVFVEHAAGEADRLSREALVLAGSLAAAAGAEVEAILFGADAARVGGGLGEQGVRTAHVVEDPRLGAYAPAAWAAAIVELIVARGPVAVIAGGSERGNEVLAHVAARTGRPMAANVIDVTVAATHGDPWHLSRQRWAGSLLEDAELNADVHLLTVAPHVIAIDEPGATPKARRRLRSSGSNPPSTTGTSLDGSAGTKVRRAGRSRSPTRRSS